MTGTNISRTRPQCRIHQAVSVKHPEIRELPTVVTLLEEGLSTLIARSATGEFVTVPALSLQDAVDATTRLSACTVLLSPRLVQDTVSPTIRRLLARLPRTVIVAVLGDDWASSYPSLLRLGACGVHQTINLSRREGWNQLRDVIRESGNETVQLITERLLESMERASDGSRAFFALLARRAPTTHSVRLFSQAANVNASSLTSRFFRAKLPTPKTYLAMMRLLYAARLFETEGTSVGCAANALHYSSPQSFGRHIRSFLGLRASEFRDRFDLERATKHFVQRLIVPFEATLATFEPLGSGPLLPAHRYRPGKDLVLVAAERRNTNA